jgi:hypothetical protein
MQWFWVTTEGDQRNTTIGLVGCAAKPSSSVVLEDEDGLIVDAVFFADLPNLFVLF